MIAEEKGHTQITDLLRRAAVVNAGVPEAVKVSGIHKCFSKIILY